MLLGGAAALGVFGVASWGRLSNYRAEWVEETVRSRLPGIDIDAASFKTFVEYVLGTERMQRGSVKATVFADQFTPWLPAQITKARDGLVGLERFVLTEYL